MVRVVIPIYLYNIITITIIIISIIVSIVITILVYTYLVPAPPTYLCYIHTRRIYMHTRRNYIHTCLSLSAAPLIYYHLPARPINRFLSSHCLYFLNNTTRISLLYSILFYSVLFCFCFYACPFLLDLCSLLPAPYSLIPDLSIPIPISISFSWPDRTPPPLATLMT